MATFYLSVTASSATASADIFAGSTNTFVIDNPLEGGSYFTFETVRNSNGFYDSSSPKNMQGTYTINDGIATLVQSDYISAVAVNAKSTGSFTFVPTNNITASTLRFLGTTTGEGETISGGGGGSSLVTTNLLYYYDFANSDCYNGSGFTINDLSGNGKSAILNPSYQPSFNANGWLDFPGGNPYALLGPNVIDGTNDNHTVEIWLKTDDVGSGLNIFSDRSALTITSGTGVITSTYHFAGAQHFFYSGDMANVVSVGLWNGTSVLSSFTEAQSTGQWFQLVRTYDGTNMKFYVNGSLINSRALTFDSPYDSGEDEWRQVYGHSDTTISSLSSAAGYFNGQMAIIRFYNAALTDSEVSQNYSYNSGDSRF